jgi:hypothetical protein
LLADVSATMAGSLNVRRSVLRLIGLLRPAFADWMLLGVADYGRRHRAVRRRGCHPGAPGGRTDMAVLPT